MNRYLQPMLGSASISHHPVSAGRCRPQRAGDDPAHVVTQCRQILLDHGPHGIEVYFEVGVNEAVACPCNLAPGNCCFACGQGRAEIFDRFADDLELTYDGALRLAVCHEAAAPARREAVDLVDRVQHMLQEQPVALVHSGRASARMRFFKSGCSSDSVQRSTFTPNASSISNFKPTMRSSEVPAGRSTSRSRSLPSLSIPLATEPKTRTLRAPCAAASARTWVRCKARAWEGRIDKFSQVSDVRPLAHQDIE